MMKSSFLMRDGGGDAKGVTMLAQGREPALQLVFWHQKRPSKL
jgi:hypothetical protein